MSNLKIAIISKSDSGGGGASRAASELARLLNERDDVLVHHWVRENKREWKPYMRKLHGDAMLQNVHKASRLMSGLVGFPDFFTPELLIHLINKDQEYDLYHLHDISTTLSPMALAWLARRKPVVWTLHDCSPFTGGCIFPQGCTNYLTTCHSCPQLGKWPMFSLLDFTGMIQNYKRSIAAKNRIFAVAPSRWMARQAVASGMWSDAPVVIPYSVDINCFRKHDKNKARELLGLPRERKIVLVGAWSITDERKGGEYALRALKSLQVKPFVLLVGKADRSFIDKFSGIDLAAPGLINDDTRLSLYYSAADVFLFPTLEDNLPNMVLESMSCGTPCIAFNVGGLPDMVEDNLSGKLVQAGDVNELSCALQRILEDENTRIAWSNRCIEIVKERYTWNSVLDRHMKLYRHVMEHGHQ